MKNIIVIVLAILFVFISCERQNEDLIPVFKYQGDKKASELINADNEFGLDLFRLITNDQKCPENFMMSPVSVAMALGMTYNGAEGTTKTAFEETLRLKDLSRDDINSIHKALIDYLLSADPKISFEIANSIWYDKFYTILQDFIDVNKEHYYAEVKDLDFNDPASVKIINDWAALKTHDKVKDVLDNIPGNAVMYLINALYFNGMWKYKFDEKNSFTGTFEGDSVEVISVKYMKNESSYAYFENELFSAVEMPYGNGNFVMNVFLPKEGKNIGDLVDQMTPSNWENWMSAFTIRNEVVVQIPKFKYEYKTLLNDPLCEMGLGEAFDYRANFSGIIPATELYISRVIHQTFIDVNEKGTEAAAVTVVELVEKTSSLPEKTYFVADKTFLYAIREKNTGALLFMGKVSNPEYD